MEWLLKTMDNEWQIRVKWCVFMFYVGRFAQTGLCSWKTITLDASNQKSASKQHAESTDHNIYPRTPGSSSVVSPATTRDFSWSCGTPLWTATLLTRGNRSLALTYRGFEINKTTAHGFVARTITNLFTLLSSSDEGGQLRSHRKFRAQKKKQIE